MCNSRNNLPSKICNLKSAIGFTLIEVMVSMAIMALVFLGIIGIFPYSLRIGKNSQNLTAAIYLAQAGMEQALSQTYSDLGVGMIEPKARLSDDQNSFLYNFWRQTEAEYVDENLNQSPDNTELKKITTTVFWQNPLQVGEQQYALKTLSSSNKNKGDWSLVFLSYPGSTHTGKECQDLGGSIYDSGNGMICKLPKNSCPGGWQQAANWQQYSSGAFSGDYCGRFMGSAPIIWKNEMSVKYSSETFSSCTYYSPYNDCVNFPTDRWAGMTVTVYQSGGTDIYGERYRYSCPVITSYNVNENRIQIGCF